MRMPVSVLISSTAGSALVLWRRCMAVAGGLPNSVGGPLGPPHAHATVPLVHLLVPAPELHPRALQHAPLPCHSDPGALQLLAIHQLPLLCGVMILPASCLGLFLGSGLPSPELHIIVMNNLQCPVSRQALVVIGAGRPGSLCPALCRWRRSMAACAW